MKKLYLVRHAKSSWKDITLEDFDRPLNKRGKQNAPFMANLLKEKNIIPDLLISSPAKRTKKTAKTFKEVYSLEEKIIFDSYIYHATLGELESVVKSIDDKFSSVFLFGHNPTLNQFAQEYVNFYDNIPTCGVLGIEFDSQEWKTALNKDVKLIFFDFPKNHSQKIDEI
jgi:phosphohistidine phosphatase